MLISLRFNLTESQEDVVDEALAHVKHLIGWSSKAKALEGISLDYLAGPRPSRKVSSSAGNRKRRTIRVYPDQLEVIDLALNAARERAGCEEDSSALTEICEAFLEVQHVGETDSGLGLALSGQHGERSPNKKEKENRCQLTSTESSMPFVPPFLLLSRHGPQHRVDHTPASVQGAKQQTGKFFFPGESANHKRAAVAISTHGGPILADPRDAAKLGVKLVSHFPQLPFSSIEAFEDHLKLPSNWLRNLSRESGERYRKGRQKKRSGGYRTIDKPDVILKGVQEFILRLVFDQIEPSPIAFAVRGRDYVGATRRHTRQPWVGGDDISDFYPNATTEMVRELFSKMGSDPGLADMLAELLTFRGHLPTGAPTSLAVTNFLLYSVDHRVQQAAVKNGCNVSRYVDDFTYSGPTRAAIEAIRAVARKEIRALGFDFNPQKKWTAPRDQAQHVHGLSVNNGVHVPKRKPAEPGRLSRKKLQRDVRRVAKYGCSAEYQKKLLGQIGHIKPRHRREALKLEKMLRSAP